MLWFPNFFTMEFFKVLFTSDRRQSKTLLTINLITHLVQFWMVMLWFPNFFTMEFFKVLFTPDRRQSKTLLTINYRGKKNSLETVFSIAICRQSGTGDKMAIENSVSNGLSTVLTFQLLPIRLLLGSDT